MHPTLYDVIGLTPEASEKTIYREVKRKARAVKESDASRGDKKNLIKILKEARDTLMDPRSREEYDRTIGIDTIRKTTGEDADVDIDIDLDPGMTQAAPPFDPLASLLGSFGALGPLGPVGSVGPDSIDDSGCSGSGSIVPFGSVGSVGSIGSMMEGHMGLLQSIIPDEIRSIGSGNGNGNGGMGRGMRSGTFHFMEYTKTRNQSGGYDEFGVTREGDTNNDRVTEKRFHRKG
jgi:curved DNA-binding protein CbpA